MKYRRLAGALAAAALCLPAACGSDDGGQPELAAEVTFQIRESGSRGVSITGPKRVPAGAVAITLENSGNGPHGGQLVRVEGEHRLGEVLVGSVERQGPMPVPDWITDGGGIGVVPGGKSITVVELLRPGSYYLLDNQSDGGRVYARSGGVARFRVTGALAGELPETDARIVATDYSFEASGIEPGSRRLTFDNAGEQLHHVVATPMIGDASLEDVKRFLGIPSAGDGSATADDGQEQPLDLRRAVSTAVLDGGQRQVLELDFEEGRYALICAIANRDGGLPHFKRGMVAELDVR